MFSEGGGGWRDSFCLKLNISCVTSQECYTQVICLIPGGDEGSGYEQTTREDSRLLIPDKNLDVGITIFGFVFQTPKKVAKLIA